jgi:hypothetical protein
MLLYGFYTILAILAKVQWSRRVALILAFSSHGSGLRHDAVTFPLP